MKWFSNFNEILDFLEISEIAPNLGWASPVVIFKGGVCTMDFLEFLSGSNLLVDESVKAVISFGFKSYMSLLLYEICIPPRLQNPPEKVVSLIRRPNVLE